MLAILTKKTPLVIARKEIRALFLIRERAYIKTFPEV